MEVNDKLEPFNPWKVEDIDQFLNYCCPECDSKQKTKSEFIVHAIDVHPNSRNYLPLFDFDEEKDQEQIIGPKDKTNFSDSELIEDEDHKSIIEPSMEKAKMDILASKSLQDNLPLLDFVKENDQCDAYLSDFEFREDIVNHDDSFEPPKKKFKNDLSVKLESIDLVLLSKMKCTACGSFFVSEESLQEHKKQIHKSKNSFCHICYNCIEHSHVHS